MKKRFVCLLTALLIVTTMILPASASSYGVRVDAAGRRWEINYENHSDGSCTYTTQLHPADRLAQLACELQPVFELDERVAALEWLVAQYGSDIYSINMVAADTLRQSLLVLFPSEYGTICSADVYELLRFAQDKVNRPSFQRLRTAITPIESCCGMDFKTIESLEFVYSEERMCVIYDRIAVALKDYFGEDSSRFLAPLQPISFVIPADTSVETPVVPSEPISSEDFNKECTLPAPIEAPTPEAPDGSLVDENDTTPTVPVNPMSPWGD